MNGTSKIFGIGLSRTGTLSLCSALRQLGYNVIHYPSDGTLFNPSNDGGCDLPVAVHFKELDRWFPSSKFIYTVRNKHDWLNSTEKHLKNRESKTQWQQNNRLRAYGTLGYNREAFSIAYDKHDNEVREYFASRNNLLILNICAGEGWEKLLPFLNKQEQEVGLFPHEHKK